MNTRRCRIWGAVTWLMAAAVIMAAMYTSPGHARPREDRVQKIEVVGLAGIPSDSLEKVSVVGLERLRAWAVRDAVSRAIEWTLREHGVWPAEGAVHRAGAERLAEFVDTVLDASEVIESSRQGDAVVAHVEARIDLDELTAFGLDRLRLLLILAVDQEGADLVQLPLVLRSALSDHLLSAGVQLLEPAPGTRAARDAASLASVGKDHRADAILVLKVRGREKDRMGEFSRIEYQVEARLVTGYSGRPLAERRFASEPARNVLVEEMEQEASRELEAAIGPFVLESLMSSAGQAVVRRVRVCGLSGRWQAEQVRVALENQSEIDRAALLLFEEEASSCAYLEVEMSAGMRDRLGFVLERLQGIELKVTGESPSWIEAEAGWAAYRNGGGQ